MSQNKESKMTSTTSNSILSLNCIIPGDDFEDIFTLEISEDKLVNQLKPMIRKWWPDRFQHIDPSKLILYKALSDHIALAFVEILKKEKEGNKNYGQRLPPLEKISMHFSNYPKEFSVSVKPNEHRVSIIVCPPPPDNS
ncbi:unnamed protein product [Rhizophagus irregularis]|uniref:Crinkler effector protein N-terminal domain-containing protein n=1 Tax=Rhizophagus irregularis TaxID=588596 RepID=A0A2I1GKP1_9GLOM|nr:hypothetical protein RhiirA4_462248 [Rhizophagus irregularis]CAB4430421.1 unnamed protein product [Rhizophagus irregularis]CAB4430506.1 unnamed protein product [Rhizophagus irregularis]